jgi:hypothetical protein
MIDTTCIVWLIVLGFFNFLTMEVLLVVGIIFPILILAACKEGYTPKEARIIRIRRIIQNLRYCIVNIFIKIISTDEIKVDNGDSM